jgi:predicted porin
MRRLLLGSSALLAAALNCGAARAAEGIQLSIGGRYMAAAGGLVGEDFDNPFFDEGTLRPYVFKQDAEIHFKGEATLDNGLTVGARVELEGATSADMIDEVFVYFESDRFGQLRFGDTTEALSQLCYLVPSASGEMFGADSPFFNFSNAGLFGFAGTNATCLALDDKVTKLVYFAQPFTGFTFALSFAPDDTQDTRNFVAGAGTRFNNDLGQNSENLSVAVNYEHDFDGLKVVVGGGASRSFDREGTFPFLDLDGDGIQEPPFELPCESGIDERSSYRGHLIVEYAGFTLGGTYQLRKDGSACFRNADAQVFGVGVTYDWQPWRLGVGWTRGDYELGITPAADRYDIISLTASYALAPGLQINGVLERYDYDSGVSPFFDYEGYGGGLGIYIAF